MFSKPCKYNTGSARWMPILTPLPEAIGFSSSKFRLGITVWSLTKEVSIRGETPVPLLLTDCADNVELSRASLFNLGLCR